MDDPLAAVSTVPLTSATIVSDPDAGVALIAFTEPNQTFVLQGTALVGCLHGALSVSNYTLLAPQPKGSPTSLTTRLHPLIAPACYSLPVIHSLANPYDDDKDRQAERLPISLASSHILPVPTDSDLGRLLRSLLRKLAKATPLANLASVLCVVSLHWANLHAVQLPVPEFSSLFTPRPRDRISPHPLIPVPGVFPILPPVAPPQVSTVACPSSWQAVLDHVLLESVNNYAALATLGNDTPAQLAQFPVLIATGTKSHGKSTFNRLAVNTLLARFPKVAVLDVDPGQAEFTPPGVLGLTVVDFPLLGAPGYMFRPSTQQVVDARYLGSVSPSSDPDMYMALVHGLIDAYYALAHDAWTKSKQIVPLVVNAMGWVKSLGLQVLCETIQHVVPTWIVVMNTGPADFEAFPTSDLLAPWPPSPSADPMFCPQVLGMQGLAHSFSATRDNAKLSPADLRLLSLTTHLLGRPARPLASASLSDLALGRAGSAAGGAWLAPTPLTHREYPMMQVAARDAHVVFLTADVPPAQVLAAINATLVALVRVSEDPRTDLNPDHVAWARAMDAPTSARSLPPNARFLGFGIVRAVMQGDAGRTLVLATNVPHDQFDEAGEVVLVRGDVDVNHQLMTWGLPRAEVARQPGPYLTAVQAEGKGTSGGSVRRNVGRFGLGSGRGGGGRGQGRG